MGAREGGSGKEREGEGRKRGKLTDTTPQLKALIRKQESTQTQPYPPSGGGSISAAPLDSSVVVGDVHVVSGLRIDHFAMESAEREEVGESAIESAGEFGESFTGEWPTASRSVGWRWMSGISVPPSETPATRHFSLTTSDSGSIISKQSSR